MNIYFDRIEKVDLSEFFTDNSRTFKYFNLIPITVFLCLLISFSSCGTFENKQSKKEKNDLIQNENDNLEMDSLLNLLYIDELDEITIKYKGVYFPPKELGFTSFTYKYQQFFKSNIDKNIVFKGYLVDIHEEGTNLIAEFLCHIAERNNLKKISARFRLVVPNNKVNQFLEHKWRSHFFSELLLEKPNYLVVAKISQLKRIRRYEVNGNDYQDEIELNVDWKPVFVANGVLTDAFTYP